MQIFGEFHVKSALPSTYFLLVLIYALLWSENKVNFFSDANLQLLFTVVEGAHSEIVRSNCTIALGDLAVRFPNLLEPWTENMYARLKDPCASVRKNAVLVLSHLILNDMMKVVVTYVISFFNLCSDLDTDAIIS